MLNKKEYLNYQRKKLIPILHKEILYSNNLSTRFMEFIYHYIFPLFLLVFGKKKLGTPKEPCDVIFVTRFVNYTSRYTSLHNNLQTKGVKSKIVAVSYTDLEGYLINENLKYATYPIIPFIAFINYLIEKYEPKVIVGSWMGSALSPLLKHYPNKSFSFITLAHSIAFGKSSLLLGDKVYLFGKSSLIQTERGLPLLDKNQEFILGGSFMFNKNDYNFSPSFDEKTILFVSQFRYNIKKEYKREFDRIKKLLLEVAEILTEYTFLVKLHPGEIYKESFYAKNKLPENVQILPKSENIATAISKAKLILNAWSNSSIEAGAASVPSIILSKYTEEVKEIKMFKFNDFFPICLNREDVIAEIYKLENAEYFEKRSDAAYDFFKYHIERDDSVDFLSDEIEELL